MINRLFFALLVLLGLAISNISHSQSFEGVYGQLGIGYASSAPAFTNNNINTTFGRIPDSGFGSTTSNFTGTAAAGFNHSISSNFLLGLGVEYSVLSGQGSSYQFTNSYYDTYAGNFKKISGTYKLLNSYNIFLSPTVLLSEESALYGKIGFTGADFQLDSSTKSMTGYSLGLGYKRQIFNGWYAFGEANYFNYGSQSRVVNGTLSAMPYTFSGNYSVTSYNILAGVGYQFGGQENVNKSPLSLFRSEYDNSSLSTQTSNELGFTLSTYRYTEPSLSVAIQSTMVGIDYSGIYAFGGDVFFKADLRYANGPANYFGSGISAGDPNWYYDARALAGIDLKFDNFVIAPYTGLGYRHLVNGTSGSSTSTGAIAYQRESTYQYIPIGAIHRMPIGSSGKLETTAEFDYLIKGTQVSDLSVINGYYGGNVSYPNQTNNQNTGYGLRLSVMYSEKNWSIGPYMNYWNIAQSTTNYYNVMVGGVAYPAYAYEPSNVTTEIGLKVSLRF
ncbi:outer membrane protein [Polynucleobacter antarcticus]|uniref:Uncharacterized protein n=1 Tax=Polynucleobacter antarcticus TaxID=1743162 RepID=A0A6M9PPW8_9BURK|nr:outer membrane beta-barrel protein [Polynucleobacter antarcticus]QKM61952.1 hypothetical protein DCO16_01960 [Polynucleobacter antarcticus]